MISTTELRELARVRGFDAANLEKVLRQVELLAEIYSHPFLKDRLLLKGGTAVNIFLLDLPRLSVKIDLDYVGSADNYLMIRERNTIRKVFDTIVKVVKYESTFFADYGDDRYHLWYRNVSGSRDHIEVEMNYTQRIPLLKPAQSRKKKLLRILSLPRVMILETEELLASKIIALLARQAATDLYDVEKLYQAKKAAISHSILKTCIIFYGIINREDFRKMSTSAITLVTERDIERTLRPLLRGDSDFDLKKTQTSARKYVGRLLRLTTRERQFVKSFFDGEYRPELLFRSKVFSSGLATHPMMHWKLGQMLKHL